MLERRNFLSGLDVVVGGTFGQQIFRKVFFRLLVWWVDGYGRMVAMCQLILLREF